MAELNFGLLTPPGSESIGNAFVRGQDQALAAQQAANQNALSQYTLGKAQRDDAQQTELYNAVRQPGFKLDIGTAMKFGAPGLAAYKAQAEGDKAAADTAYRQGQIKAQPGLIAKTEAELAAANLNAHKTKQAFNAQAVRDLALNPSDENIIAYQQDAVLKGIYTLEEANRIGSEYLKIPIAERAAKFAKAGASAEVTPETIRTMKALGYPPTAEGHQSYLAATRQDPTTTLIADIAKAKANGASLADIKMLEDKLNAPAIAAKLAQDRFVFDKQVEAWKRANPSLQLVQNDNGFYAVDPKTLQVREVNITGGAAPAMGGGAPAASVQPVAPQRLMGASKPLPEAYTKELKGVINTTNAIANLENAISNFSPTDMINPSRRAEINQAHKTAVLLAKEMFNLGVLNGGDQKILEQVIPDPVAFSKGLIPIETIRRNLTAAKDVANNMNQTLAKVHKQPLFDLGSVSFGSAKAGTSNAPPIQSFRRPS